MLVYRRLASALTALSLPLLLLACDSSDSEADGGQIGRDAVASDAGRRDASAPDAGRPADSGMPGDASLLDAQATDLAVADSGSADAGPETDAAVQVDAGSVDAGPTLPPCGISIDAQGPAQLRITADDARTVYLNGVLVEPRQVGWNLPSTTSHSIFIHPLRPNTLAVHAENLQRIDGFDRGLIAELTRTTSLAVSSEVVTSSVTKVATSSVAGWTEAEFDDSAWAPATVLGPHGMAPWGAVLGTSNAEWIWTYDSNIPASQKPDTEPAFVRMNFYVHRDGRLSTVPDACAP